MTISVTDFIFKNIITINLLLGLVIVVYANRRLKIPTAAIVVRLAVTLFLIMITEYLYDWTTTFSHPTKHEIVLTVIKNVVRPFLFLWEIYLFTPDRKRRIIYSIPANVNVLINLLTFVQPDVWVFVYDENNELLTGPLWGSTLAVKVLYLIILTYQGIRFFMEVENRRMLHAIFYTLFTTVLTGILENMNLISGVMDKMIAAAFIFYYMYLCSVRQEALGRELIKREKELGKNRLTFMQNQIKPHFIYNSLTTIQSLCTDSEAIDAISEFAGYLRGSVDVMTETECIPVHRELETVKNYIAMEKRRFGDKLQIELNIEEEAFLIPTFSIQILVENAIVHGIRKKEDGKGTVMIHAYAEDGYHVIDVTDDGIGYDMSKDADEQENHVGLMNLNTRLEMMCNGTLEIISSPGDGTTTVIRIPAS